MPAHDEAFTLRDEIAASAARLIADSGLDYASAKRKAAQEILGAAQPRRSSLPDNQQIDAALLSHLELFDDEHPARVLRRRQVAADLMKLLEDYNPMITGAVWKGIVAEHAPIHIQSFSDNAKEMAIFLINQNISYEPVTMAHLNGRDETEAMVFYWRNEPVILSSYDRRELRSQPRAASAGKSADRGSLQALMALITT